MKTKLLNEFTPRSFLALKTYNLKLFYSDLSAGITVGIVALPLALAFAIASGVDPEKGLYTAIIAGFLISALGGSRLQIGGPTGAFVVIIYDVVQKYGYQGLAQATFLAGIMLLIFGFLRLGTLIKFIPFPVTTGFTTGIATIIASSQVKEFFGLNIEKLPADFIQKWELYFQNFHTINYSVTILSLLCLAVLILQRKYYPKLPGGILVIIFSSLLVYFFKIPALTIGDKFGTLPNSLPTANFDFFEIKDFFTISKVAFTIALLAAIESLLSAVVADSMSNDKHSSNCELVAQGIANIASIVFGGIPATGAIARTATSIKSGAQTPVAGMIHSLTLLLIMFFFAPYASMIPLCVLASILMLVSWNMAELDHFLGLLKAPRGDVLVLLLTFILTICVDLTVAVEVGIVLAALLFMKKMSDVASVVATTKDFENKIENEDLDELEIPEGVEIFEIKGPLFFGVADRLKDTLGFIRNPVKVFILKMNEVPIIDASGLHALYVFAQSCKRNNIKLRVCGTNHRVEKLIRKHHLIEFLEIVKDLKAAIDKE
ncbi:MAG: sulfate permease [Proteobacteria bacterium]|nr:sulfate permease [Pseudomonadota bacterium]